jgi:hypothetical protein
VNGDSGRRLRPSPPPLQVDLGLIMTIGTVGWVVVLVILGVLALAGKVGPQAPASALAGALLGLYGISWSRRRGRREPVAPD